jgi:hypothetical protein
LYKNSHGSIYLAEGESKSFYNGITVTCHACQCSIQTKMEEKRKGKIKKQRIGGGLPKEKEDG